MKSTVTETCTDRDVAPGIERDEEKRPWEPMKLTYSGDAKDIVRSGGGKVGITAADMGDTNKPPGQT